MKRLTDFEKHVILDNGTEAPFTGEYCDFTGAGTYQCKGKPGVRPGRARF